VRPTWAVVDLDAVRHNVALIAATVAPAQLCVVVKADGYGHGAVPVAQAALDAGATWLAVALVEEGVELRRAGVRAPVLVLAEATPPEMTELVEARLRAAVYSLPGIEAAAKAVAVASAPPLDVHLKIDTGMHRVGADPAEAVMLARAIVERPELRLEAVWTHCAVADEPDDPFTACQLDRLDAVLAELAAHGIEPPLVHAANSAAALAHPHSRRDLVRCGIAAYGIPPAPVLAPMATGLRPALSLRSTLSYVRRVPAGDGVSYGLRHVLARASNVATVPIGYADGVARRLSETGGEVLVRGRRRPIVGVVTMDQLMVDCGDDAVERGDEVVLIGEQGPERVSADEWAQRLGTIAYEIVCGVGPRVPRRYVP
jgi:alanine racemase